MMTDERHIAAAPAPAACDECLQCCTRTGMSPARHGCAWRCGAGRAEPCMLHARHAEPPAAAGRSTSSGKCLCPRCVQVIIIALSLPCTSTHAGHARTCADDDAGVRSSMVVAGAACLPHGRTLQSARCPAALNSTDFESVQIGDNLDQLWNCTRSIDYIHAAHLARRRLSRSRPLGPVYVDDIVCACACPPARKLALLIARQCMCGRQAGLVVT